MAAKRKTARSIPERTRNGLTTFAMHVNEAEGASRFKALRASRARTASFAAIGPAGFKRLDPDSAAQRYLYQALQSDAVPQFTTPELAGTKSEFRRLGTETIPLTGTRMVKFRQTLHGIPVYGSLVSVELDDANECLSISSAMGTPSKVDPVAKVSPGDALKLVKRELAPGRRLPAQAPQLHFYFDAEGAKWRLVYIVENVPTMRGRGLSTRVMDFIVDAQTGRLIHRVPRTSGVISMTASARDALGKTRRIRITADTEGRATLRDEILNVHTHDFRFGDPDVDSDRLPGPYVTRTARGWSPDAVGAHANAAAVSKFLRTTLRRANIDNRGGKMVSTVNCVVSAESDGQRQWANAYWDTDLRQMVYGQRMEGERLVSLSANLDIVAHEMFHGVTDFTARLEYETQSGALNESYSDIFGVIVSNANRRGIADWEWLLGEGRSRSVRPFRDMSDPPRFEQPKHMRDYRHLPNTEGGDWGGVHDNSGIHNYAAYKIMTAKSSGRYLFTGEECAALFYVALTQRLSRTSGFRESRMAVLQTAQTLFRNHPAAKRKAKVRAIAAGFAAAGIEE